MWCGNVLPRTRACVLGGSVKKDFASERWISRTRSLRRLLGPSLTQSRTSHMWISRVWHRQTHWAGGLCTGYIGVHKGLRL